MSITKVKNTSESPFILPGGQTLEPGKTADVQNWDEHENHILVKAWVNGGKLEVGKTREGAEHTGDTGNGGGTGDEERLRALTIQELTAAIEKKGGKEKVKSGMGKDDLVKLALELKA